MAVHIIFRGKQEMHFPVKLGERGVTELNTLHSPFQPEGR